MVELAAVNRSVVGSNPTSSVFLKKILTNESIIYIMYLSYLFRIQL
jgi:hypothetical protein